MTTIQDIAEEIYAQLSPQGRSVAILPEDASLTPDQAAATEEIFELILQRSASLGSAEIRKLLPGYEKLSPHVAFNLAVMDALEEVARKAPTPAANSATKQP